jgi:hypothetical protein
MSDQTQPYIQRKAGDPWTVEDFTSCKRWSAKISTVDRLPSNNWKVDKAHDSTSSGNTDEYAKAIVDCVLAELPKRTGYMMPSKMSS